MAAAGPSADRCTGRTPGKQVDPRIVQWWVVKACSKSRRCPVRCCAATWRCAASIERQALAKFVLSSLDRPRHRAAVARGGRRTGRGAETDRAGRSWGQQQYYVEPLQERQGKPLPRTVSGVRQPVPRLGHRPEGDAGPRRGGRRRRLRQAVRTLHPQVVRQPPGAVQMLWSRCWPGSSIRWPSRCCSRSANRFRTKAIRKRRRSMSQALADREGWTIDELADRTIPDAGFARPTVTNGNTDRRRGVAGAGLRPAQVHRQAQRRLATDHHARRRARR